MLKFGFIGLNNISEAMCLNLMKKVNIMVFVSDSSIARVEYLSNHGAVPCEIESDVIDRADIILIAHNNFVDLQATIYSIIGTLTPEKIILDMSVISPSESAEIAEIIKPTGAQYADLALLNSFEEVEQMNALLMYGGASNLFLKLREYLRNMCGDVVRVGDNTSALSVKVCYNILYTQIQNGVNEMLLYASNANLIADDVINVIQSSPIRNKFLEDNGKKIAHNDYIVKTKIKDVHKQLEIAHDVTTQKKIPMRGINLAKSLYDSAIDRRLASHDITEIFTIVERASHS